MSLDKRYKQRLSDFKKALNKLQAGVQEAQSELEHDGVIQRFEFTYEQAWKAIKLWLAHKDIDVRNAKDALKAGLEQGLIEDGNLWLRVHESRNLTSHTYDEKTAGEIFVFVRDTGCGALEALLNKLEEKPPA